MQGGKGIHAEDGGVLGQIDENKHGKEVRVRDENSEAAVKEGQEVAECNSATWSDDLNDQMLRYSV